MATSQTIGTPRETRRTVAVIVGGLFGSLLSALAHVGMRGGA